MRICFTGHRDRITDPVELDNIHNLYRDATWIHGGAEGFDAQVDVYARKHGIPVEVVRPDYSVGNPKSAPIIRNMKMVDSADILVACYDGRLLGGTLFTIKYARKMNKEVIKVAWKD